MGVHRVNKQFFRQNIVSLVFASIEAGMTKSEAIAKILAANTVSRDGKRFYAGKRTIYRWIAAYKQGGTEALANKSKISSEPSKVLPEIFLDFLKSQKIADEECSIPDVIKAAEIKGLVKQNQLSRTTVWRAARKLNLPLLGTQGKDLSVKKRFEYPHRMQMVLCDGKHFRAGKMRTKRVVFTFIDDATRKVLGTVVGKSENKKLFLRGIHKVLLKYGKMVCLFVDNGSGFVPHDVEIICARLGIHLIYGTAGYPEGHGKIERFNQTIYKDLLRTFAGDPSVDDSPINLEMRIEHYIREMYNQNKHAALKEKSPNERWDSDSMRLASIDNIEAMEQFFVINKSRKVSNDNIVKIDNVSFEVPCGHSGRLVNIEQDFINARMRILHDGKMLRIIPVNLNANAKSKRANSKKKPKRVEGPINNAARIAYNQSYKPVVNSVGDCPSDIVTKKE
jgi:transposase InsO family protein